MECGGAGIHSNGMLTTDILLKLFLKLLRFWPCRNPTRPKGIHHFFYVIIFNEREGKGKERIVGHNLIASLFIYSSFRKT
jgi:hypothetical protein